MSIFIDFTHYFLLSVAPIIKEAEKEKFYFPEHSDMSLKLMENNLNYKEKFPLEEFYQSIKLKKLPIEVEGNFIYLSQREIEVLREFIHGKSAKVIARNLGISYKTVEIHLYNIRQKLACWTRGELIDKILSINVVREYLLKGTNQFVFK